MLPGSGFPRSSHARRDEITPIKVDACWPRRSRAPRPELDSTLHILLEDEPAWARFCDAVAEFTGVAGSGSAEGAAFAALSPREHDVLVLITEGLGNAEIAERLGISEKTVRNHVSNVFDKLGVWSRAQAIVFARDRGFGVGR